MATEVLEQATEERLIRRRATIEEFWSLPESVLPTEYINGEIITAPTPTVSHQTVLGNMFVTLHAFVKEKALGRLFLAPLDVALPTGEVVQPDIFMHNTKQAERVSARRGLRKSRPFSSRFFRPARSSTTPSGSASCTSRTACASIG